MKSLKLDAAMELRKARSPLFSGELSNPLVSSSVLPFDRRLQFSGLKAAYCPFCSPSGSEVPNQVNQIMEDRGMRPGLRQDSDWREDSEAVYIRKDIPGMSIEDLKLKVEGDILIIEADAQNERDEFLGPNAFIGWLNLPSNQFNLDDLTAIMKNGVLLLKVPKLKLKEEKMN